MAEIALEASLRSEFGKGAARRLRRDNQIPAVLYGHGGETIHLSLPAHATTMALRAANALLSLKVAGGKDSLALPKQIQRDPVRDVIEHVDLVVVRKGEKVHVEVPVLVVGEPRGEAVVIVDQTSLQLEVEATHIPAHIEIDVDGQEIGYTVTAADLVLPQGATYVGEPTDTVVSLQTPQAKDMGESAADEAAAAEEPASESVE
ncbi:MAG: 50S ribosomal protein L25/general stress protein Ctc [Propionibacteriaceae bacterium]|jgi:large subunit ribosomal protein L25|nr:50S ribosomal protein L25/general stress protein Ctc [Propionibacteriaceae bacterium]